MTPKEISLKIEACIEKAMSEGNAEAELQLVLLKTNLYDLISKILTNEISNNSLQLYRDYQTRIVS